MTHASDRPHETLIDVFTGATSRSRPDLLRYKERGAYRDLSSEEFARRVRSLACWLAGAGIEKGDRVAILSENRPEWSIADFACQCLGAPDVPIYTSLSAEQIGYILRDSGSRVALVSTPVLFERLVHALRSGGALGRIVLFDRWPDFPEAIGLEREIVFEAAAASPALPAATLSTPPGAAAPAAGPGQFWARFREVLVLEPARELHAPAGAIEVTFLEEAYRRGAILERQDPSFLDARRAAVGREDLASVIYTSGTTGEPKGVMLTHGNFGSNVDACLAVIPFDGRDVALSFLPLSHVFERMVEYAYLAAGGSIAFAESFDTVAANILEVRPTVFGSVPRLFEKIHARIIETARSGPALKRALFDWAVETGRRRVRFVLEGRPVPAALALKFRIADKIVFSKIKAGLGGRVRFLISGGAPLARELAEFFLSAGITVLEGYGLTETSPVIAVNTLENLRPGTVGKLVPGVEVKIAEDGEILVRGPNVMRGYLGKPEATREVIVDGWFATGDIGTFDADGYLVITDRKKDLLITSGGKNIAPQPIENALKKSAYISNAVLVGDRRNYITAIIVPDFEALGRFVAGRGLGGLAPAGLVRLAGVLDLLAAEIESVNAQLASYERVKKFTLLDRDLTIESGEMTPTLKVRRRVVADRYGAEIEAMYGG